jgi:hypothetical protein
MCMSVTHTPPMHLPALQIRVGARRMETQELKAYIEGWGHRPCLLPLRLLRLLLLVLLLLLLLLNVHGQRLWCRRRSDGSTIALHCIGHACSGLAAVPAAKLVDRSSLNESGQMPITRPHPVTKTPKITRSVHFRSLSPPLVSPGGTHHR